jgi:hypothetical protein
MDQFKSTHHPQHFSSSSLVILPPLTIVAGGCGKYRFLRKNQGHDSDTLSVRCTCFLEQNCLGDITILGDVTVLSVCARRE